MATRKTNPKVVPLRKEQKISPDTQSEEHKTEPSIHFQVEPMDEDEEKRSDTLYEVTDLQEYSARRVETDDISDIKKLLREEDYNFFHFEDPNAVFEKCCFSVTIADNIEIDRIVAAAFFDDKPIDPDLKTYAKMWKRSNHLEHMTPLNTFYMHLFAGSQEVQSDLLLTEIIAYTFSACQSIEFIIVELPNPSTKSYFVFNKMVRELNIRPTSNFRKKILIYEKEVMFPKLKIREGREHDLDDLAPLLPMDSATIAKEFGKAVLSDIIAMCDKNNQSMVAEWNNEAVGIISVCTDIDYEMLNHFFHLEPFHGLHKPHSKDQIPLNYNDTNKLSEVPVKDIMAQARQAMDSLKARNRRRADQLPYIVEKTRDDFNADYESDDSAQIPSDNVRSFSHQFCSKVSQDIIRYGLRSPSVSSAGNERPSLTACMNNFKIGGGGKGQPQTRESTTMEEETNQGVSENEKNAIEENVEESDLIMSEQTSEMNEIMRASGEWEDEDLMAVFAEFIDEEGEENESEYEDNEQPFDVESQLEQAEEDPEEMEEEDEEEFTEEEEGAAEVIVEQTSKKSVTEPANNVPIPEKEVSKAESLKVLPEIVVDENKEEEKEVPIAGENKELAPIISEDNKAIVVGENKLEVPNSEEPQSKKSQTIITARPSKRLTSKSKKSTDAQTPLIPSSQSSMALLQNKHELQKRMSDDNMKYLVTSTKNLEEKVEIIKKVWEMYHSCICQGFALEKARETLSAEDRELSDQANIIMKGNLFKFLALLQPDEIKYPFQRKAKPDVVHYHGIPNALAVKLFNVEKKFNLWSLDLLRTIFKSFPNREYLIVTAPQGSKEPAWLDHFVRVVPRVDSSYPRELFVLHKVYLTSIVKVRRAKIEDVPQVIRLVQTLTDNVKIIEDFKYAVCCKTQTAFVAQVKNHPNQPIIGMAIASDDSQSQAYHINYDLNKHTYYFLHDENSHAYIHHLIIYPIFQRFSRTFTKEIMRMMNKTNLYQRNYPDNCMNEITKHQSLLNNIDDWIPLLPRKRVHYTYLNLSNDAYDLDRLPPPFATNYRDPYSIIHFGKKFSYDPKINLNTRIVFVGASETVLSCIEKMLASSFREYKRLTIIDPYGLPGQLPNDRARDEFFSVKQGGKSMSFDSNAEWVQRMGIKNWVNVVLGWVTRIQRDKKRVVVNKDRIVPYDILILAPGRQFQRLDCPEAEIDDPNFIAFKKKVNSNKVKGAKPIFFKRETPKPRNVFTINTEVEADISLNFIKNYMPFMKKKKILVFGGGLRSYACIKALLLLGVPAPRIVMITSPGTVIEWEAKSGYDMTNTVKIPMEETLKKLGVFIVDNYEFSDWELCPVTGQVKRTFFSSPTEMDSRISFATFAIFCYRHRRVNDDIVSALTEAYILYQDGIIIDENFKTNDPNIYAAGPAAVYKRILLANHQDHQYYQSEEIGHKLAEFLIERSGSEGGGAAQIHSLDVIKFHRPFIRSAVLVGGWHYLYMRSPGAPLHRRCIDPAGRCDEACECSTEIVTGSVDPRQDPSQKYFKLRLDDQSRIVGVECMSMTPFSASNLMGLYGKHEVILNKMMERLEKGETKDLYEHFCQPWYGVFCMEHFETFLNELKNIYKTHDIGDGHKIIDFIRDFVANLDNPESLHVDPNIIRNIWDSSGIKSEVELKFLALLKYHKLVLPMYARNDYVEDLLEERSTSTLYYPNPLKY